MNCHLYLYAIIIINFYDLSTWSDCWTVVSTRRFIYNFLLYLSCYWARSSSSCSFTWMLLTQGRSNSDTGLDGCVVLFASCLASMGIGLECDLQSKGFPSTFNILKECSTRIVNYFQIYTISEVWISEKFQLYYFGEFNCWCIIGPRGHMKPISAID